MSPESTGACVPYPAQPGAYALPDAGLALAPHWGECCYYDGGGVSGGCPSTLSNDYAQCVESQYCGHRYMLFPDGGLLDKDYWCCGDRWLAGLGYSPIDPYCLPTGADGGP